MRFFAESDDWIGFQCTCSDSFHADLRDTAARQSSVVIVLHGYGHESMTYEEDYSIPEEILEQICAEGFGALLFSFDLPEFVVIEWDAEY